MPSRADVVECAVIPLFSLSRKCVSHNWRPAPATIVLYGRGKRFTTPLCYVTCPRAQCHCPVLPYVTCPVPSSANKSAWSGLRTWEISLSVISTLLLSGRSSMDRFELVSTQEIKCRVRKRVPEYTRKATSFAIKSLSLIWKLSWNPVFCILSLR